MQLDPQLASQKKKLQLEITLKDSDIKRNLRQRTETEIAIRELKNKLMQVQSDIVFKENVLKKILSENMQMQNELIKLKHQINNLGR